MNQRVGALLEQARGLDPRQAVPLLQQASGLDPSRDDVKRELQRRLDELNAHTPPAGSSAAPGAGARDSASAAKTARDADASAIVQVLNRYRLGWEGLDVNAIQAVYPGVNAKTLRDEFKNVKSQPMTLSLQPPDFDATGNAATIRCHVVSRIDVKAGAGLKLDRDAVFHLAKAGGAWRITSLDYR